MCRFRSSLIFPIFLLLSLQQVSWAAEAGVTNLLPVLEEQVRLLMDEEELVGAGFTVVYGNEVLSRSYGKASIEQNLDFTVSTPNALHELAQPFTAVAILQLVEQGRLDLDAPFTNYFPDFIPLGLGSSDQSFTIRQLLSHHSGLPAYYAPGSGFERFPADENEGAFRNLVHADGDIALVSEPGKVYEYSYLGYSLLGVLIEEVSGLSYQDYMQQHILQPLGMGNSAFVSDPNQIEDITLAYRGKDAAGHRRFRDVPGAGLVSTLQDMGLFMRALLDPDSMLISQDSRREIFSIQNHMVAEDGNFTIGLGFFISPVTGGAFRNLPSASHASTDGIARSYLLLFPQEGLGVLLTTNSRLGSVTLRDTADKMMTDLLMMARTYVADPYLPHAELTFDEERDAVVLGNYSGPGGIFRIDNRRNRLRMDVPYIPFLNVELLPREEGYYGVDIRFLGLFNLGRMSQVRMLSESLEGKVEVVDGQKLFFWYWRGITAVTLTELPEHAPTALEVWRGRLGDYNSDLTGTTWELDFDRSTDTFTFAYDPGGIRLFREPPEIFCASSGEELQTCGRGLVGNGTRNRIRLLDGNRLVDAYGLYFSPAN